MKKTTLLLAHFLARRACLSAALGLLAALVFGLPPAQAAVTEAWVHRYNNVVSNANGHAVKVVCDAAGDIIVTGRTHGGTTGQDMLTIKYSGVDGSVLWQQCYNGAANRYDSPSGLALDGSGNAVVTGVSNARFTSDEEMVEAEYYTAKYAAADGALLWERRYKGPGNYNDLAQALAVDGSGNVVVTGYSYYNGTLGDYYTAKYAAADGALLWEKRYDGARNSWDSAEAVAVDSNGNVVVTGGSTGISYDYYTAKYAGANGALLWEKRYNGPANGDDEANAVAVDGGGNVVVSGTSWNGTNADFYTAKYAAADGALLWEKRYYVGPLSFYAAQAVVVDSSGNVVVSGTSLNGTSFDYYTAKYAAADGALLWEQRYNGPANSEDQANAVAVDGSGNVVVTGFSFGTNGSDYYTAKYAAADGSLLWEQRFTNGAAAAVAVDGSGNVVVTGYSDGTNFNTAKYAAADGAFLWGKRYGGPFSFEDYAQAVVVDSSGNVVVTGYSYNGIYTDYYTAKYAPVDGALLWEQRYNGPANGEDDASAVALDASGDVVVTGYSFDSDGLSHCYTAKYAAADGMLLWEKRYNGASNNYTYASAVVLDGSGNVVVTGVSGTNGWSDYYTAKYAAADGALLWEKRYNGPANSQDSATAVAVDGSGNVVVTGNSDSATSTANDYYTAKYAAADGALLWEKRGPRGGAEAVAVDASANVVVTGSSNNATNSDYYTAKYAAANGALLWEKRYNGPANSYDDASAVVLDGSGNVVVTGSSHNATNSDYYTAKYAAANGALLWEQRYNGPANGDDFACAVAVDGSGNVVVTGLIDSGWEGYGGDYYTAKYSAADGALLWEKRYNGPANGDDRVAGLALGPNGMVAVTGTSSGDFATVVYRDDVYPISIALVPAGVRLRFIGIPGRSYTIERAPAVTGPWSNINIQTAPASGLLEYLDAPPPPGSAFYRTVQP